MSINDAIEREVNIRVAAATERFTKKLNDASAELRSTEFNLAIARWAIAGILSRNLHVSVNLDASQVDDPERMADIVGRSAGQEFLHAAELHFNQHAEHAKLLDDSRHKWVPHTSTELRTFAGHRAYWPKP